jgi:uncharacterized protein (TIGR00251 family)
VSDLTPLYQLVDDGIVLNVHVSPGAGRSAVVGRHGDALKVRVAAPPVGGRANEATGALLAETFDVKDKQVELVSGETSRTKRFRVSGIEQDELDRRLHLLIEPGERPRPT